MTTADETYLFQTWLSSLKNTMVLRHQNQTGSKMKMFLWSGASCFNFMHLWICMSLSVILNCLVIVRKVSELSLCKKMKLWSSVIKLGQELSKGLCFRCSTKLRNLHRTFMTPLITCFSAQNRQRMSGRGQQQFICIQVIFLKHSESSYWKLARTKWVNSMLAWICASNEWVHEYII